MKEENSPSGGEPAQAPSGLAAMLGGLLEKYGGRDADIEEDGKKIRIRNGEIHVVENGMEIFIGKNGIRIRKLPKDGEQPAR